MVTRRLRTAAIMVAMRRREFDRAAELAEAARRDGVADASVFGLRGHALSSLGRHEEANLAYAEALKLAPEDPYVRHLVVAAGLLPQASRAPTLYLETVFDGYATRFESHLIGLQYRVPGLLRAALPLILMISAFLTSVWPTSFWNVGSDSSAAILS